MDIGVWPLGGRGWEWEEGPKLEVGEPPEVEPLSD